jgi:Cu2+-exporting ATPase
VRAATIEQVQETSGRGVSAMWRGLAVSLGRPAQSAGTSAALAIGAGPVRLIGFADRLRPDAQAALAEMAELSIEASILSGDNAAAVAVTARETGLTGQASALPADKLDAIQRLQRVGKSVLMVGDGINDGPALAAADASIAPGSASDVGRQAADFVFTGDSLLALPRAVRASRRTMRVVRENFSAAILYNAFAVPLAMAGLVTPLMAAIAMATSSLIVVANSLRLTSAAK